MSSSESEYTPAIDLDLPPSANLRRRKGNASLPVSKRKSKRKKSIATTTTNRCLPKNLKSINPMLNHVTNRLKGNDLDESSSLRIVKATLELQKEYLQQKRRKKGTMMTETKPPAIRSRVCGLFGISTHTYGKIVNSYMKTRSVYSTGIIGCGRSGNRTEKRTRIPRTKQLQVDVRNFVREERLQKRRVTGRQIMDFFIKRGVLIVPRDKQGKYVQNDFNAAYRATRRWLHYQGYKRGRRKNITFKTEILVKRNRYLRTLFNNRKKGTSALREVYLDESYIHQHYHRLDDSIWDPNDDQDIQVGKLPHGGSFYCFLAAIQGPNPHIPNPINDEDKAGLVPNSLWAFCPQRKRDHHGDYHKVFNGTNFLQWWQNQLLPNLKQPSLIIMDNAAYHKVYPAHIPKVSKLKKAELVRFLVDDCGLQVEDGISAVELRQQAKDYIQAMEKIAVVAIS